MKCIFCDGYIQDDDYEKCGRCEKAVHRQCGFDAYANLFLCRRCESHAMDHERPAKEIL